MANISRNSFDESKSYDKVILQQGVPITDYDFNEAQDIQRFKLRRIMKELFGDGAIGDGFKVIPNTPNGQSVVVSAGTLYVSGWRITNTANYTLPMAAAPGAGSRTDYVWVEVTETEVDAIMDPSIKHEKLTIEPTRRTKVGFTLRTGTVVPADTADVKNYTLANVSRGTNDNVIGAAEITDARSVKVTFEGAGFSVKGSVTLGDDTSDVIDIQGKVKNTSNNFGGKLQIEDSVNITNDLDVGGYVKTVGINVQTAKRYEVGRLLVFGGAGDIQYQSDSTTFEDVTGLLYDLFDLTAGPFPAIPTGATRYYKMLISYSQDSASNTMNVRLVDSTAATVAVDTTMTKFAGDLTGGRRFQYSAEFQRASDTTDWKIQAKITAGNMTITGVEVFAYDVY